MCITKKILDAMVTGLTSKKLYRNERQLQLDLAFEIKEYFCKNNILNWRVEMEYLSATVTLSTGKPKSNYTDIMLISDDGEFIPIELKYKTKTIVLPNGTAWLKTHGAQDFGRYDFLWDVKRIEELKAGKPIIDKDLKKYVAGFAIMVTNDPLYYAVPSRYITKIPAYIDFSIYDRLVKKAGVCLSWKPTPAQAGWRSLTITLDNTYTCNWFPLTGKSSGFKSLIFEI